MSWVSTRLLVTGLVVLLSAGSLCADDIESFPVVVTTKGSSDGSRCCGLYSIYMAGKLTGTEIDLGQILSPQYLTGQFGSSVLDLRRICERFEMPYRVLRHAGYGDLCLLDGPALLLVKNAADARTANHWVVMVSADWDSVEVYDPEAGLVQLNPADLMSVWGGVAIAVFPKGSVFDSWLWGLGCIASIGSLLAVGLFVLKTVTCVRVLPRSVAILAAALILTIGGHVLSPLGFARNLPTVTDVTYRHSPPVYDKVDIADLPRSDSIGVILVDVRTQRQYNAEHIPGSINIPIDSSFFKMKAITEQIDSDSQLILYCNSPECGWAESMARSSMLKRFRRVSVFPGGLADYRQRGSAVERGERPADKNSAPQKERGRS